jgi:hypothetical protein
MWASAAYAAARCGEPAVTLQAVANNGKSPGRKTPFASALDLA